MSTGPVGRCVERGPWSSLLGASGHCSIQSQLAVGGQQPAGMPTACRSGVWESEAQAVGPESWWKEVGLRVTKKASQARRL